MTETKRIVFHNLLEASTDTGETLGRPIDIALESPAVFSSRNAEGAIAPMSFEFIGERAKAFGLRVRAEFDASQV